MKEYIAEYIVPVEKKGNDYMFDFMNATPMIRCKDCKYNPKSSYTGCPMAAVSGRTETDYCSRAERRGEEE